EDVDLGTPPGTEEELEVRLERRDAYEVVQHDVAVGPRSAQRLTRLLERDVDRVVLREEVRIRVPVELALHELRDEALRLGRLVLGARTGAQPGREGEDDVVRGGRDVL